MPKSVRGVMREFKQGALHSGSSTGPKVTSRKQAVAIALSEQRQMSHAPHPAKNLGQHLKPAHDGLIMTEHHRNAKKR